MNCSAFTRNVGDPLRYRKPTAPFFTRLVFVCSLATAASARAQPDTTYADVAPILAQRCVMCHSGEAAPAGLRLDSFDAVLTGSAKGPVVKAGALAQSELLRRIKGTGQPRMPMTGPPFLSDNEIAIFERWIAGGLKPGTPAAAPPRATAPKRPRPGEDITYLDVAPIFATRCAKCHTDNGIMGPPPEGYRLTSYESTLTTSDRARIVPGKPDASELVRRIRGQALPRMPFGDPALTDEEIRLIEDWIAQGAPRADGTPAAPPVGAEVRLHGTLGAGNRLDGLALVIGPRTRIDKSASIGDYVQVRGYLDEGGHVIVERLRSRRTR